MNCKTARAMFSARLDGGLSYEEVRGFQDHLARCAGCAGEYAGLERTVRLVRSLPEVPAPSDFVQGVVRAARQAQPGNAVDRSSAAVWRERLRGFLEGFAWIGSPRFAAAALALGLVVGMTGSMLIFRPRSASIVESFSPGAALTQSSQPAPSSATPVASTPPAGTDETAPPSGPFDELVQEMLRRAGTTEEAVEDSVPDLDWGISPDAAAVGRQVHAGPGSGATRDGRVTRVF